MITQSLQRSKDFACQQKKYFYEKNIFSVGIIGFYFILQKR